MWLSQETQIEGSLSVSDARNLSGSPLKEHGVNGALALGRVIIPAVQCGEVTFLLLSSDICMEANASLVIAPECQSHLMCVFQPRCE